MKVLGIDPSLRNWGLAHGNLDLSTSDLKISKLEVVNPVLPMGKQVRQNSLDLAAAYQLFKASLEAVKGTSAVFVEVPVGSKSARAMASYGTCVGVLGALKASGTPFFEVTPTEVKLASCGFKTATKEQMIAWATQRHPEANWPTYKTKGSEAVSSAKAEHMADAIGAIYAGINTDAFKQLLSVRESLKGIHENSLE